MLPSVAVKLGRPASTDPRVLLPAPLGPITACTSPSRMVRFTPFRFFISSKTLFILVEHFFPSYQRPDSVDNVQGTDDRHDVESGGDVQHDVGHVDNQPDNPAFPAFLGTEVLRKKGEHQHIGVKPW